MRHERKCAGCLCCTKRKAYKGVISLFSKLFCRWHKKSRSVASGFLFRSKIVDRDLILMVRFINWRRQRLCVTFSFRLTAFCQFRSERILDLLPTVLHFQFPNNVRRKYEAFHAPCGCVVPQLRSHY